MALLRMHEIREMAPSARDTKLKEIRDELLHERGVAAMGGAPHSPGQIRALRKNLARILTVMREEELAKARAPPPEKKEKRAAKETKVRKKGGAAE